LLYFKISLTNEVAVSERFLINVVPRSKGKCKSSCVLLIVSLNDKSVK